MILQILQYLYFLLKSVCRILNLINTQLLFSRIIKQKMEKVPEIRLYSTGQNFRRTFSPSFTKQFVYSNPTQTFPQIYKKTHTYSNNFNHYVNEQNQKAPAVRPFQTNYYQNAIRICEDNNVLNSNYFHLQNYAYLKNQSYLEFLNHRGDCKNQERYEKNNHKKPQNMALKTSKSLKVLENNKNEFKTNHELDVYRRQKKQQIKIQQNSNQSLDYFNTGSNTPQYTTQRQKTQRTDIKNNTPLIKNTLSTSNLPSDRKSITGPMSFTELTNIELRNQNSRNKLSQVKKSSSPESSTLINTKNTSKFNQITQSMQKMFHQFNLNVENQQEERIGTYLIEDLQEITRQNINLKRQYLSRLDQILQKVAEEQKERATVQENQRIIPSFNKSIQNKMEQQVSLKNDKQAKNRQITFLYQNPELKNDKSSSNLQSSKFGQESKRRKKLFVTQVYS